MYYNLFIKEPLNKSRPADWAPISLAFFSQIVLKSLEMRQYPCVIFEQFAWKNYKRYGHSI